MYTPKISIIIPVYNVEKYLCKCIDSVVNQSYRNLEIILIDDGSTDDSGKICDEYAIKDSRVKVIHKINQGVAHTRNIGVELARGEYIMFVDSDDWVDLDICAVLIKAMMDCGAQSAMCSYVREYPEKSLPKQIMSTDMVFSGRTVQRRLCGPIGEELKYPENLECFNTMCGRVYPANALRGRRVVDLKEIGSSEDLLFNLEVFSDIESMAYINRPLYHYRKNVKDSITSMYRPELDKQWDNLYTKMIEIIKVNRFDQSFYCGMNNRIALNVLGASLNCVQDDAGWLVKCRRVHAVLGNPRRKEALKQLSLEQMPLHWKLYFFSAKYKLTFVLCILSIIISKLKGKV